MYAMVSATEVAICAACNAVVQLRVPILGVFSGTTMESPGFKAAFRGLRPTSPSCFSRRSLSVGPDHEDGVFVRYLG